MDVVFHTRVASHTSWPSWRKKEILTYMRSLFAKLSTDQERDKYMNEAIRIGKLSGIIVNKSIK